MPTVEEMQKQLEDALGKMTQATSQIADIQTKNQEMQSQMTTLSEENSRLKGIVETFGNQPPPDPGTGPKKPAASGAPDPVTDPDGYAAWVDNTVAARQEARNRANENQASEAKRIKEAFYAQFPHLVNHAPLVAYFSSEVLNENPKINQSEGFKKVAEKCDAYLASIKDPKTAPKPPHMGGGGAGGEAPKPKEGEEPPTPEPDELQASIKERKAMLDRKAVPPGTTRPA